MRTIITFAIAVGVFGCSKDDAQSTTPAASASASAAATPSAPAPASASVSATPAASAASEPPHDCPTC